MKKIKNKNGLPAANVVMGVAEQSKLTSECWSVQLFGLDYCETCPLRDTPECGGRNIRRTGRNSKGVRVPIGELYGVVK